jgi:antitoxin component YwqK of YwqJK toxin-antitoxin module
MIRAVASHFRKKEALDLEFNFTVRTGKLYFFDELVYTGNGILVNKIKEGYWFNKDSFDNLLSEGRYINGKKEGHWIFYGKNGDTIGSFRNDEKIGRWTEIDRTISIGNYIDGRREGLWILYTLNHIKISSGHYYISQAQRN